MNNFLDNWKKSMDEQLFDDIDFTEDIISDIVTDMGLNGTGEAGQKENLERYIFRYGNEQEIYCADEISFIESVDTIYIFNDIKRKIKGGTITTRVFVVDLSELNDSIKSCFFLMKIINKSNDSFNVFLMKTNEGIFLGCRLYNKEVSKNCTLSRAITSEIQLEEFSERLMYLPDSEDFIPYYGALVEAIECENYISRDYEKKIMKKRGDSSSYLSILSDIESVYHISLEHTKEMYYEAINDDDEIIEVDYASVISNLDFIKSNRVNTLEMLFEAEEVALLINKIEKKNDEEMHQSTEETTLKYKDDEELKMHLDNPEEMIKILKEKRGL